MITFIKVKTVILILITLLLFPSGIFAWNDCPYEKENDTYPGDCGRYIDTDHNGICDHSEPSPEERNLLTKNSQINSENQSQIKNELNYKSTNNKNSNYHFVLISVIFTLLYFSTYLLSKKRIISLLTHKTIWNTLLLITFLSSGILGMLVALKSDFNITQIPLSKISYWHIETGIAMFVISFFHIVERLYFFKNIFPRKK